MFGMLVFMLTIVVTLRESISLSLKEVSVPAVVMRGDPVHLNCSYDLKGDKLYSVKWHKDNVEFYRYLPDDHPSGQKYDLEGIHLDMRRSREGYLFMSRTDVHSEGIYRCEVSTDAPSFQTVKGEGEMRIYVFPSENPKIIGHHPRYTIGDEVNISCVAAPSRPAAFLKWFINGKEAPGDFLSRRDAESNHDGLLISNLGLRFVVDRYHFPTEGTMVLHCEAIISQAHTLSSEEILVSQNASDSKASGIYSSSAYNSPRITGGRNHYQVGDVVDINCTASKSQPPAEIHWYINDKEARPEYLVPYKAIRYVDGHESTLIGLRFETRQRHFQKGQMRLRCTAAALSEVMRMSSPQLEVTNSHMQQVSGLHVYEDAQAVQNIAPSLAKANDDLLWCILLLSLIKTVL